MRDVSPSFCSSFFFFFFFDSLWTELFYHERGCMGWMDGWMFRPVTFFKLSTFWHGSIYSNRIRQLKYVCAV
ncbi:hypothetical protein BJ741DRAFT_602919 [Chytriomyces cf. hyalinus JEL632]|nr:hypothetical protein BJ741DRAFT_602919 [Chytriomyces cf. hyalinus JEL632]